MRTRFVLTIALIALLCVFCGASKLMAQTTVPGLTVITGDADEVGSRTATLRGTVIPTTTIDSGWLMFEYGEDITNLNQTTPGTLFAGPDKANFLSVAANLKPETSYCFRAVVLAGQRAVGPPHCFFTAPVGAPTIAVGGAGAVFGVPGSMAEMVGNGFNASSRAVVNGIPVTTVVESDRLIMFQVPTELPTSFSTTVYVANNGLESSDVQFVTVRTRGWVLQFVDSRWRDVNIGNPLVPDSDGFVNATIVGIGFGLVTNQVPTGQPARAFPLSEMLAKPQAWFGGDTQVTFAGLMPSEVGLYQINIRVRPDPASVPATTGYVLGKITLGDGSFIYIPAYILPTAITTTR